jgi:hypothetical protein
MISTVTLSFDLTYTNPVTGALQPRGIVVDSTDYAGLGIDLLLTLAKGLGVVTFNGDIIVDLNTIGTPMIDLQNWDYVLDGVPTYTFDLPLDLNGNVANGVYTFEYSLRLNTASVPLGIVTIPTANTIIADGTPLWLVDFLEPGDDINLVLGAPAQFNVFIQSIEFTDPNINIITSTVISSPLFTAFAFDITNLQFSGVFSYAGCTQVNADVSFVYDCEVGDNGTWAVANTTPLAANEVVANLNCTINYPSWAALSPTFPGNVVVTSLPYPSAPGVETPLATGTYTVSLTQQIQQTQTSGLIVLYSRSVIKEFQVSCAGSLCGLVPCIENLRAAHQAELVRNRISKYQVFVDNVLMYYIEAMNYRSCGELDKYRAAIAHLQAQLDASGCDCACCDDETYYWVSNNSGVSVIESLIASFQFRLFDGIPGITEDVTQGVEIGALWQDYNTGILYRCTVNTAGSATWVEYYAPGVLPIAADIPAVPSPNFLTANNVQLQLDQVDALAVFDGINGLNKVGNDVLLGGALDGPTTINCDNGTLTLLGAVQVLEVYSVGNQAATITVERAAISTPANNIYIETTTTSGAGADGIGSSILMRSQNAAGSIQNTSKIISTWVDATAQSSDIKFTTKLAGVESTGITLNPNSSITLNEYNGPNFEDASPAYLLGIDALGNVVQSPSNALVYAGRTRFSGGAIAISEYANTTGATISISNSGVGVYTITASSAVFTANTIAFVQFQGAPGFTTTLVATSSTITIRTYNAAGVLDDAVIGSGSFVKIEVYP